MQTQLEFVENRGKTWRDFFFKQNLRTAFYLFISRLSSKLILTFFEK